MNPRTRIMLTALGLLLLGGSTSMVGICEEDEWREPVFFIKNSPRLKFYYRVPYGERWSDPDALDEIEQKVLTDYKTTPCWYQGPETVTATPPPTVPPPPDDIEILPRLPSRPTSPTAKSTDAIEPEQSRECIRGRYVMANATQNPTFELSSLPSLGLQPQAIDKLFAFGMGLDDHFNFSGPLPNTQYFHVRLMVPNEDAARKLATEMETYRDEGSSVEVWRDTEDYAGGGWVVDINTLKSKTAVHSLIKSVRATTPADLDVQVSSADTLLIFGRCLTDQEVEIVTRILRKETDSVIDYRVATLVSVETDL